MAYDELTRATHASNLAMRVLYLSLVAFVGCKSPVPDTPISIGASDGAPPTIAPADHGSSQSRPTIVVAYYAAPHDDGVECAVRDDGAVLWSGYLHMRTQVDVTSQMGGATPASVQRIVCGRDVLCLRTLDRWTCAGYTGTTGAPQRVSFDGLATAEDVVPVLDGVCSVAHGELACWGDVGISFGRGPKATALGVSGVVKLDGGPTGFAIALTNRHEVYCWGRNVDGVCGSTDLGKIIAAPKRMASGVDDVLADTAAAWLLRGDGVLLGIGRVEFPSPLRKLHHGGAEGPTSGEDYFYADEPIPVPAPGPVKRLLEARESGCVELRSGETGCVDPLGWHARPPSDFAPPCVVSDGGVTCGGEPHRF